MSQNDDGSAFLHSNELRESWVHLRESLLEGSSVASLYWRLWSTDESARTDVRNRRAFAKKLKVIGAELRKRMAGVLFTLTSSLITECLPDKL